MLRSRIIPCLLIHDGGLFKTVKFKEPKYVGDPINAVRIFNEKEVDELAVFDIDATVNSRPPNLKLIEDLAAECRMPLCYGGGVSSAEQAAKIVGLGVEKVAVSAAAIVRPSLISEMAIAVGNQSVVAVLDVKKGTFGRFGLVSHNAKKKTKLDPFDFAKKLQELGVGEIVVNSVDNDGLMSGYDVQLATKMRDAVDVPITVMGGAGSHDDLKSLIDHFQIIGAAAGSLFVFKGKYRAVLINYPTADEKVAILQQASNCSSS